MPAVLELSNGVFRAADQLDVLLVELSAGGAAIIAPSDRRYKIKKRYRVWVDDQAGILELRNVTQLDDTHVHLGVSFHRLDLVLQELVVDSLDTARQETSRISEK